MKKILLLMMFMALFGQAQAQRFSIGAHLGVVPTFNIHVGVEQTGTTTPFGARLSVGITPDSATLIGARLDGYVRFGFAENSLSGVYVGLGAMYFYLSGTRADTNAAYSVQSINLSGLLGLQLEVVPSVSFFAEGGLGLPVFSRASESDLGSVVSGLFLSGLFGILRLNLGLNFHF